MNPRVPYTPKHACSEHDPCEGGALHIRNRCEAGGCAQFADGSWFMRQFCWLEHPGQSPSEDGQAAWVRAYLDVALS